MMRVNYLVQVTSLPSELPESSTEALTEASTEVSSELYDAYKIYQMLIDSNFLWRVWLIDDYGQVWVEVNFINDEGEPEFHTIAVDYHFL